MSMHRCYVSSPDHIEISQDQTILFALEKAVEWNEQISIVQDQTIVRYHKTRLFYLPQEFAFGAGARHRMVDSRSKASLHNILLSATGSLWKCR